MSRMWLFAAGIVVVVAGLLAGCTTKTVPYDQSITAVIEEISGENPVRVAMKVDDQVVFEAEMSPKGRKSCLIHNPERSSPVKLIAGTHKIWWEIHRNHPWGKVGNAQVTVYSGTQQLMTSNSKWIMPLFKWWWTLNIDLQPSAAPPMEPLPAMP